MNPEDLKAQYAEASKPFIGPGSAITLEQCQLKSWRYFVEIGSGCNLRCSMCVCGNREGYDQLNGFMSMELLGQVLDKIRNENQNAVILPYGNSEPMLHPKLPECISAIKSRGFGCEIATNLNVLRRVEELLAAGPNIILVSVSGFTQETYVKAHVGGDIEKVKANMKILADAKSAGGFRTRLLMNYHRYKDNSGDELANMKAFAEGLGYEFQPSVARAISMENTIQYLRKKEMEKTGEMPLFGFWKEGIDLNTALPPANEKFSENIDRLLISPEKAVEMYEKYPVHQVCPVGDMFTFVRHDGLVSMCPCVADRRLNFGKFLEKSQEELSAERRGHPLCQQCLKYRMNLYFHIVDRENWS